VTKPLPPKELAAGRVRCARHAARRRENKHIRWDGRVGYDGVVLGMLILRGLLSEAETAGPAKVNAALTQLLFYEVYKDEPFRIRRCVIELLSKI
jgi:hypothetical protein